MAKPIAIISDPHGNLQGLEAVLKDIEGRNIQQIYCLGDVIGYCGQTAEVTDRVMNFEATCRGNHDEALGWVERGIEASGLQGMFGINSKAAESIVIATQQIKNSGEYSQKRLDFLLNLPEKVQIREDAIGLHAVRDLNTPTKIMRYTLPDKIARKHKIDNYQKADKLIKDPEIFSKGIKLAFIGHSHLNYIWIVNENEAPRKRIRRAQPGHRYILKPNERALVNVGSTGLHRNQNHEFLRIASTKIEKPLISSYAILKGNVIEFAYVLESYEEAEKATIDAGMHNVFEKLVKKK